MSSGTCRDGPSLPMVIYHPGMNRALTAVWVVLTVALSVIAGAGVAHADPPPPPGTLCSFTLSVPQVMQVAGKDMVSATLTPDGCAGAFRPYASVVCVQGADSPAQCTQARDTATAQVYVPYRPGGTYTSTGRGLGTLFNDAAEPNWQLLGPLTAVL
jgi:hypothetical protein